MYAGYTDRILNAAAGKNAAQAVPGKTPRWDMSSIYPGFDSKEYLSAKAKYRREIAKFLKHADDSDARKKDPESWLEDATKLHNSTSDMAENLESYAYALYSVDTQNKDALRELNALEEAGLPLRRAIVLLRNSLSKVKKMSALISKSPKLSHYEFFIKEALKLQEKQMSPDEEDLASDLSRPGSDAWSRLQEVVSSTLSMPWADGDSKTVIQLRGLAYHEDREVRKKAYELELAAWKQVEIPMAYALNGVKGFSIILNGRRGYQSTLERSIQQSRINEKILSSMTLVMEESLPVFRRYLNAKAKLLGVKKTAFFDIFAPVGDKPKTWKFPEAKSFILDQFSRFTPELGDFAAKAFDGNWIDAEPRKGKAGGAYCISYPLAKASRIMANFDGSFSAVSTIAHELGHGYHHEVLKDASAIHRGYPMTLAETASIFCETIIFNGALATAGAGEKITILETLLQEITQVIVDILSRFKFENRIFELRAKRELGPDEFCDLMVQTQKETYGSALDPAFLHPYMWAVKGHYYRAGLAYYNFPYAFGQLFGLGLYGLYQQEPDGFPQKYRKLLALTGRASARDVTREAGFDIEKPEFWREGIRFVDAKVKEFEALVNAR